MFPPEADEVSVVVSHDSSLKRFIAVYMDQPINEFNTATRLEQKKGHGNNCQAFAGKRVFTVIVDVHLTH
jgi:hypothetical protein